MQTFVSALVLVVALTLLPVTADAVAGSTMGHDAWRRIFLTRRLNPAIFALALFAVALLAIDEAVFWRQKELYHLLKKSVPSSDILLVPGWAQFAFFGVVPSLLIARSPFSAIRRFAARSQSEQTPGKHAGPDWGLWAVLICNVLALGCSLPSYTIVGENDMVIRPWPYGLFAMYRLPYNQVAAVSETSQRNLGRFGMSVPILDYEVTFYNGLSWDTRLSADGSTDAQRIQALSFITQRSGVRPMLFD